jgi:hypothetical protein
MDGWGNVAVLFLAAVALPLIAAQVIGFGSDDDDDEHF